MTRTGSEPPHYVIDGVTLRERLLDPEDARAYVAVLDEAGPSRDGERVAWLRMLGELRAAERLGWDVLRRAGGPSSLEHLTSLDDMPETAWAPAIRLGHVLHWQGRFDVAAALLTAFAARADVVAATARAGSPDAVAAAAICAFARQHLGKCRYDQGRLDDAARLFGEALALRIRAGAPADQIVSSRQAVHAVLVRRTCGQPP